VKAKIQTLIGMHGFPRLELPGEPVILKVLCMEWAGEPICAMERTSFLRFPPSPMGRVYSIPAASV